MKQLFLLLMTIILFNTVQAASIQPISNGNWQTAATWPNGELPGLDDDVIIPAGFVIDLEGTIEVKSITVIGILRAQNTASIDLKAEWILVNGSSALFEVGTESLPYTVAGGCLITLVGPDDAENHGMGDKFIGAMNGGRVELHGEEKISWTHLGADANTGASQITLSEPVDWEVGDEIVIVSSRLNWEEAEKRTITAIGGNGLTITLNNTLNYPHVGVVETYTRNTDNKTWTADLRAEVGLLTRNVTVQGDAQSETNGFGGHIMAMMNSTINASNIELYRMGQKSKLGRYPWHWHMLHDFGTGQYFKNSSVHDSYNRGITIHGTNYALVEDNFFYKHIGHGVFLEDGSERFNTIKNNVALLSIRPAPGEEVTASDNELYVEQNRTPATFWITNPNNYFEGNVAAGTEGTGYWFAFPKTPMGASANDSRFNGIEPWKEDLGLFKNNTAHSTMSGFDIYDELNMDHSLKLNVGWNNSSEKLIEGCTWYANTLGIYTGTPGGVGDKKTMSENLVFYENILVDNVTSMMLASYSQVKESVFVANSGNDIYNGNTNLYRIYDGAAQLRDCHLVGWRGGKADFLKSGGAASKHTNHRLSGITTDDNNIPDLAIANFAIPILNTGTYEIPQNPSHARVWNTVFLDEDGSFAGEPNSSIVSNHPMMLVGDEFQPSNWENAYRSPHRFVLAALSFPGQSLISYPNLTCARTKLGTPSAYAYDAYGYKEKIQFPVIVNEGFKYTFTFESLPSSKNVEVVMDDAAVGDNFILKFADFGKLGGLSLTDSGSSKNSLAELESSSATAYYTESNGDLYIKYVATQALKTFMISWTTDFAVPMLDTDEDGVSDRDEIIAGKSPFAGSPDVSDVVENTTWDFDSDIEGWNSNPNNMSVSWNSNGYLDCTPSGGDPYVYNADFQPFDTNSINYLDISVKNGTSNTAGQILIFTANSGVLIATIPMTANSSSFETIEIDLSTVTGWSNSLTVTNVRLDPNNSSSSGTISYDHIYFKGAASSDILVSSIAVSGPNEIDLGATGQMSVTVAPANATNQSVVYSVNSSSIATINASTGVLTPLAAGTVTVIATALDGTSVIGTKSVNITDSVVVGWNFDLGDEDWDYNPNNMSVSWNSNGYLDCVPSGNDPYVWNQTSIAGNTTNINYLEVRIKNGTSNTEGHILIFTANSGVLTATIPMTANSSSFETILIDLSTVSGWTNNLSVTNVRLDPNSNGASGTISYDHIYFKKNISVSLITVSGPSEVDLGSTGQMSMTVAPANATNQSVVYSVNDTSIATINASTGLLTSVAGGTVTVIATAQDGSGVTRTKSVDIIDPLVVGWDFVSDVEGWNSNPHNMSVSWNSNGYLDCVPSGNDPYVWNQTSPTFHTYYANYLEVSIKNGTSDTVGHILIFTANSGVLAATIPMTANSSSFETIAIDLSTVSGWTNNLSVTNVRLDPNSNGASGTISYDHVYFKRINDAPISAKMAEKTLSLTPKTSEVQATIYPNPVKIGQDVVIRLSENNEQQYGHVTVYDLQGRTVISRELELTQSIRLSTEHLTNGLYIVHLNIGESRRIFKVIVN